MEMLARLLAFALSHLVGLAVGGSPTTFTVPHAACGRIEHFVLELVPATSAGLEAPAADAEEVGLAVLRRRREGSRSVLEWELRLEVPGEVDTRVHHVEVQDGSLRKLVWREYRPGAGRTLFLEELPGDIGGTGTGTGGTRLRAVEWGGRDGLREEVSLPEDGLFPLELLERARAARLAEGEIALFDALEQRFEPVLLRTRAEVGARPAAGAPRGGDGQAERLAADPARPLARTLEIHRRDGSLAGAYRFAGSDLVAFQWQAGGARGRLIPAEEWSRRSERLDRAESSDGP